ncbi:MAG TPA: glycosyltransferase family 1 protein [Thermoanaerobaculia bacterium]|nr:glycosyltransferase family 1 protein [Thermoanaerobaculia bacterium]
MLRVILHTLGHAASEALRRLRDAALRRERPLRIGVDIRPFYEPLTGVGWYLYHLLHEIAKHDGVELWLFGDARVTDEGPRLHADVPSNAHLCWFDLRGYPKSRLLRPLTAAAYVVWMKLVNPDVMFGANYFLPRLLGAIARRRVITIHDLTYKRFPELLQKETLQNLEHHMKREIAHADAVICVSESTRRDVLQFYEADPRRIVAIRSGLTVHAETTPVDLPKRYILFVSTIEPRKNLPVLLDAFQQIDYDGALVVVGKVGWKAESIAPRLRERNVIHLDYLDPARLAYVYEHAELFVFPSIYEGFGFPLGEAMAHGVPAIAARSSSLPEIGGNAALYFAPHDTRELAQLMQRVLGDPALREELVARGRKRAAELRWETAASRTLEVLRQAAS